MSCEEIIFFNKVMKPFLVFSENIFFMVDIFW